MGMISNEEMTPEQREKLLKELINQRAKEFGELWLWKMRNMGSPEGTVAVTSTGESGPFDICPLKAE